MTDPARCAPGGLKPVWNLFELMNDAVIVADETGSILYVNQAIERLLGWPASDLVNKNLTFIMPARMHRAHVAGMQRYVQSRRSKLEGRAVRLPSLRSDGSEINVELTISLYEPAGSPSVFLACMRDLTDKLEAQRQISSQRHLLAQHAVTSALARSTTLHEAVLRLLQELCTRLNWDLGFYWQLDTPRQELFHYAAWVVRDSAPAKRYLAASKSMTFRRRQGVPGIVWDSMEPSWRGDLWTDPDYTRAELARTLDFHEAVLFPVIHQGEVLGVLEFVSRKPSQPDQALLGTLATACFQVGQFQERVAAEARLRRSKEYLATMLRSIGDAVIATDTRRHITFMNRAAETLTGHSQAAAIGRPIEQVSSLGTVSGRVAQLTATKQRRVLEQTAAQIAGEVDKDGAQGEIFVLRDVTQQQLSEDAARLLTRAFAELTAALGTQSMSERIAALVVPDFADACFIFAQPRRGSPVQCAAVAHCEPAIQERLRKLAPQLCPLPSSQQGPGFVIRTGTPQLDALAQQPLFCGAPCHPAHRQANDLLQAGSSLSVPLLGRQRVFGALSWVIRPAGRRFARQDVELAQELARDLSQALENACLYNEAQEAVAVRDNFLVLASHELKTPLTPLKLQVQSLTRHSENLPPKINKKIQVMADQIARLEKLVSNLLEVSCLPQAPKPTQQNNVDLMELIKRVAAELQDDLSRLGLSLSIEGPQPLMGRWDGLRLEQLFNHLLVNAIKFGNGSPIGILVSQSETEVLIQVSDSGIGIEPADQERIFGRFERAVSVRKFGGFGLGLYICKQVVETLGGRIWVHSTPNKGSTFFVALRAGA